MGPGLYASPRQAKIEKNRIRARGARPPPLRPAAGSNSIFSIFDSWGQHISRGRGRGGHAPHKKLPRGGARMRDDEREVQLFFDVSRSERVGYKLNLSRYFSMLYLHGYLSNCLRQTPARGPRRTVYELRVSWGVFGTSSRGLGASWERCGASWGRLGSLLGRLGGFWGASWGVLGGKTVLEPSWSRLGAVLEASWKRLGDVLGRLGSLLRAFCGRLGDFLGRLVGLLARLGASWSHLVLDSILDTIL